MEKKNLGDNYGKFIGKVSMTHASTHAYTFQKTIFFGNFLGAI